MPFLQVKTNVTVTPEQAEAVRSGLGESISIFPGKSEAWLMLSLEDGKRLWFQGTPEPAAIAEISLYAREVDPAAAGRMTAAVTALLSRTLGVPARRIYVKYDSTPIWGWNGNNF